MRAFNAREIATAQIQAEFRFITEETTLQEVIDRLGEPTSLQPLSVNPRQIRASQLIVGPDGGAAIVVAEYELPNGAAVTLVPAHATKEGGINAQPCARFGGAPQCTASATSCS